VTNTTLKKLSDRGRREVLESTAKLISEVVVDAERLTNVWREIGENTDASDECVAPARARCCRSRRLTLRRLLTQPPRRPPHFRRHSSFIANYDHIEELVKTRFPVLQQHLITWPAYELACRPAGMETLAMVTYEQMRAGTVDVLMGFEQFGHFLILASQRAVAAANAIRNPNASAETEADNPNLSILTAVSGYTAVPNADGTTKLDGANMKDWRAPEPAAGDMEAFLQQDKAEERAQQREAQKFEDATKVGKRPKSPRKGGAKKKKSPSKAATKKRAKSQSTLTPSPKPSPSPSPSLAKTPASLDDDHNTFTDDDVAIAVAAGLAMMGGAAARQAHKDAVARRAAAPAGGADGARKRGETRRPSEVARSAKAGGKRTRNRRASSKALDIARAAAQSMGAAPSDPNHVPPAASAPPANTSGATPAALAAMEKMRNAMKATDGAQGEFSFIYRYILRESCSQFDSLPLTTSLTTRGDESDGRRAGAGAAEPRRETRQRDRRRHDGRDAFNCEQRGAEGN
jgi:hypothetical protein